MTSNEQMLGDLTPPQLRPYFPQRLRRCRISNICNLCSKSTSEVSCCLLGVQQQMSRRDGTAPGSAAIKEPLLPVLNAATYRENYWSKACCANTINLMNGKGKNFVKMWPIEVGWLKKTGPRVYSCLPLSSKTFLIAGKSLIYWCKLFPQQNSDVWRVFKYLAFMWPQCSLIFLHDVF